MQDQRAVDDVRALDVGVEHLIFEIDEAVDVALQPFVDGLGGGRFARALADHEPPAVAQLYGPSPGRSGIRAERENAAVSEHFDFGSRRGGQDVLDGGDVEAFPADAEPAGGQAAEEANQIRSRQGGDGFRDRPAFRDETRSPKLIVRDCQFEGNRARGVLAHSNAVIERCQSRGQTLEGVLLSPDLSWMEGPEIVNVRVVGNLFDGVDRWGTK